MSETLDPRIALLLEALDRAYDRTSWHGPNLRGSVRGVNPALAGWRPGPGRHSIAEQVLHAAYWKYVAWRRLTGARRGSFPLTGSNWFPAAEPLTAADWKAYRTILDDRHRELRAAVAALNPDRLDEPPSGRRGHAEAESGITTRALVLGVAAHDLYHAGQIQLLRRMAGAERAS